MYMKRMLLGMFAVALAATATASQSAPTVQVSERGALTPKVRMAEGSALLPIDCDLVASRAQARVAKAEGDVQSLDFSLAFDPSGLLPLIDKDGRELSIGTKYYQAFELSAAQRALYAGKKITSINITSPVNRQSSTGNSYVNEITKVVVFLTHGLDEEFFYKQSGRLGKDGCVLNKIVLDTPYVIEADKPLYIGYFAKIGSKEDYPLVLDGIARKSIEGGYYAYAKGAATPTWINIARTYGNLCIGATIEGENLPEDGVSMYGIDLPTYTEPDKPFSFDIGFAGAAINKAESVELEYKVGDQAPETVKIPFEAKNYLGFNQLGFYTVRNVVCNQSGTVVPFSVKITKVNGNPNISEDNEAVGEFHCFDSKLGYKHRFVVEEGTGTWCGWCPRGFVMMEYLKEKYPEDFIRVALHGGDEMAVSSTNSALGQFPTFPGANVDRTYDTKLGYSGVDVTGDLTKYYEANKDIPACADVDLEVDVESGAKKINISTTVKFAADAANNDRYRLAYYVIENNVGPYKQNNAYSGGSSGKMGGWENKESSVEVLYDDVARNLVGTITGLAGSLPAELKAGESYSYTGSADISNVENDDFNVVAMVVDSKTYRIINAKMVSAKKSSGVETVTGDATDIKVSGGNGEVIICGSYGSAAVYDVAGRLVATASGEASVSVPSGIYIVKADNVAAKVVVR